MELDGPPPAPLASFLIRMRTMSGKPLASYNGTWTYEPQTMVPIAPTARSSTPPQGMVAIPPANFSFVTVGIEIEGDDQHGVDIQFPPPC